MEPLLLMSDCKQSPGPLSGLWDVLSRCSFCLPFPAPTLCPRENR